MAKYLLAYRGETNAAPTPPDENETAAWMSWFGDLGDAVVEIGNPILARSELGTTAGNTVLNGFSIIQAPDLETAVTLAKGCPVLQHGGGVEVGELAEM